MKLTEGKVRLIVFVIAMVVLGGVMCLSNDRESRRREPPGGCPAETVR